MKAKRHVWMLTACLLTAVLTLGYLKITQQGEAQVTWLSLVWVIAFAAILFAAAELGRLLFVRCCPKLAAGEKRHLMELELGTKEIMGIVFCVVLTALSFLPAILDSMNQYVPEDRPSEMMLDTAEEAKGLETVGLITRDIEVDQTFENPCEYLYAIELKAATLGRENDCTLMIALSDPDTLEEYEYWEFDSKELEDGDPVICEIRNPDIRDHAAGRIFMLQIFSEDAVSANAISMYRTVNNTLEENGLQGKLLLPEDEPEGILVMKLYGNKETERFEGARIWMCVYTAVLACTAVWLLLRKKDHKGKTEEK